MKRRVDRFRYEYAEDPEPVFGVADASEMTAFEANTYTTYEYEGVVGESRRILGRIHEAVDERAAQSNGTSPHVVVLGIQDYVAVDAWVRYDSDGASSINDVISADIVTVPGRMIYVPMKNEQALIDYLKQQSER